MRQVITWLVLVSVVPYLTGCEDLKNQTMTGRLWQGTGTWDHSEAAMEPGVKIYQTPDKNDFYVCYDEVRENDAVIKRRAYLLKANEARIESDHRPKFSSTSRLDGLQPLPLVTNVAPTSGDSNTGMLVVLCPDQIHFALLSGPKLIGVYHLPNYVNAKERAKRIALTPLAVTGDAAVYTAVAALLLGVLCLEAKTSDDSINDSGKSGKDEKKEKAERKEDRTNSKKN
jgi:hypothetical protein